MNRYLVALDDDGRERSVLHSVKCMVSFVHYLAVGVNGGTLCQASLVV